MNDSEEIFPTPTSMTKRFGLLQRITNRGPQAPSGISTARSIRNGCAALSARRRARNEASPAAARRPRRAVHACCSDPQALLLLLDTTPTNYHLDAESAVLARRPICATTITAAILISQ